MKQWLFSALLGFTATVNFILQYGQFLKQLDFSILSALWNEKYGSKFDYVSNSSESKEILDYFLKPPLEKVRCFIWLLEDNRENFPSLHQALDEFFNKTGKYAKVSILTSIESCLLFTPQLIHSVKAELSLISNLVYMNLCVQCLKYYMVLKNQSILL